MPKVNPLKKEYKTKVRSVILNVLKNRDKIKITRDFVINE
jgi:hypothetical protein